VDSQKPIKKRKRSRSRDHSPELEWKVRNEAVIKLSNLPPNCNKYDIKSFLFGIRICPNGVYFKFSDSQPSAEEVFVVLEREEDIEEALSYSERRMGKNIIEVTRANPVEFDGVRNYERKPRESREYSPTSGDFIPMSKEYTPLRLRGLPFSARHMDIKNFFYDYKIVRESVKFGRNFEGRKTGEAVVLFETQEEAQRAIKERQGQHIGHRWIELFLIHPDEYAGFDEKQLSNYSVSLAKFITPQNKAKTLKLRGLPFNVREEEIVEFFAGFDIVKSDVIIERDKGKSTGNALVTLRSEEDAARARKELEMKFLGKRYVEIFPADSLE